MGGGIGTPQPQIAMFPAFRLRKGFGRQAGLVRRSESEGEKRHAFIASQQESELLLLRSAMR